MNPDADQVIDRNRGIALPHLASKAGGDALHFHADQVIDRNRGIHLLDLASEVRRDSVNPHAGQIIGARRKARLPQTQRRRMMTLRGRYAVSAYRCAKGYLRARARAPERR